MPVSALAGCARRYMQTLRTHATFEPSVLTDSLFKQEAQRESLLFAH
jgi:hypothetical protein